MNHHELPSSIENVSFTGFGDSWIDGVARAHRNGFPGYLLTEMGDSYVKLYYRALLDSGLSVGVVAIGSGREVVGLAIGSVDLDAFQRYLYRHTLLRTAGTLATQYLSSASVRRMVNHRLREMPRKVRLLLPESRSRNAPKVTGSSASPEQEAGEACYQGVTLMSIAVSPEHRGSRVATDLVALFEEASRARGEAAVRLSVERSNARAIRFYEKSGYTLCLDRGEGLDYRKLL